MLLQVQNRHAEAKARYQRIVELDGRAVVAVNSLAYIYLMEDTNLQEALELAQKAKAISPDDPDVNDTLGWAYLKTASCNQRWTRCRSRSVPIRSIRNINATSGWRSSRQASVRRRGGH